MAKKSMPPSLKTEQIVMEHYDLFILHGEDDILKYWKNTITDHHRSDLWQGIVKPNISST
jgi:hypothetical protein